MGLLDSLIQSQVGPYSISDEEKKRLKKVGLLQAGLAMLATPTGTGSPLMGISRGLLAGVDSMQQGAQDNIAMQYKMDRMASGNGTPADIQIAEYYKAHPDMLAQAIKLRQASANPYGFEWVTGEDGVPRMVRTNRHEGTADIAPVVPNGPVAPAAGVPQAPVVSAQGPMDRGTAMSYVQNLEQSQGVQFPPAERLKMIAELTQGKSFDTFVPRTKEAEAAAVTGAQERTKFAVDQQRAGFDAAQAGNVAAASATGKIGAEAQAQAQIDLPGAIAKSNDALKLIDGLLLHPGRSTATGMSSVMDPRNYLAGSDAKDFRIKLGQLKGKAFLEAFQSLKGGGQITEVEGQKATDAIAAMDTAQSDEQFAQGLRDLREVIQAGAKRARDAADGGRAPSQATAGGPQVGEVKNGYRFKGGNPADPFAWEKL